MKNDTKVWLTCAGENLEAATILLEHGLYNPCLQNVQQSAEKSSKALLYEKGHLQRKTHSIAELVRVLAGQQVTVNLNDENCDLLDSIYLPSKYPLDGVLPAFDPDKQFCRRCVALAEDVIQQVREKLG